MTAPAETFIRVVQPSDAPSLADNCLVRDTVEQVAARIQSYLGAHAAGECLPLVAESDGMVVGLASLRRKQHPLCRHRADLVDMVVSGAYQGRGIARRLIDVLREHASQIGVRVFETRVRGGTPAEQVYRRVGFQEYGRLPGGIVETWGEHGVYDEVLFWMPTDPTAR